MESYMYIVVAVGFIFGILQIILFIKLWIMTNDIRQIKNKYMEDEVVKAQSLLQKQTISGKRLKYAVKKNKRISLLALVISALALILVSFHVEVTVTNETFIGIMASFMGAAATIIVGAQIYNSIEMKKQMSKLKKSQKKLKYKAEKFDSKMNEFNQEVTYNVNEVSACTLIAQALAYMNDNPESAYCDLLGSIYFSLENYSSIDSGNSSANIDACFNDMELILEKKGIKIESDDINDAINDWRKNNE